MTFFIPLALEHDGVVLSLSQTTHRRRALGHIGGGGSCVPPLLISGSVQYERALEHDGVVLSLSQTTHRRRALGHIGGGGSCVPPLLISGSVQYERALEHDGVVLSLSQTTHRRRALWLPILTTIFILVGAPLPPHPRVLPLRVCSGGVCHGGARALPCASLYWQTPPCAVVCMGAGGYRIATQDRNDARGIQPELGGGVVAPLPPTRSGCGLWPRLRLPEGWVTCIYLSSVGFRLAGRLKVRLGFTNNRWL